MKNLRTAMDINVYIRDRWADKNITTAPGIKTEILPDRTVNITKVAVKFALDKKYKSKNSKFDSKNAIIQALGSINSVDLRDYRLDNWSQGKRVMSNDPDNGPYGPASSLFLNTVHMCFSDHFALGIRPDALMYLVLHEVGIAIKQNPETYRHLFTKSMDKELINVFQDDLQLDNYEQHSSWSNAIEQLNTELGVRLPSDIMQHLLPSISTHDLNSLTASKIAVLDAASPYYAYMVTTACGIPSIRLFGTGQDYDNLVTACEALAVEFKTDLSEYFKHLIPVLKEIADTATGRKEADNDFWKSIYKHHSGSGTDAMSGWIGAFFNYITVHSGYIAKSSYAYDWKDKNVASVKRSQMPDHVSSVPFIWNYYGARIECQLMGGFLAVENIDNYATPTLSWAVVRKA